MSTRPSVEELTRAAEEHPLEIIGQVLDASNAVFFARLGPIPVAYKPVRGERPLWDFPTGCLAHRERACYLLDAAGGFDVVPPTILLDGPAGPGAVQWWITDPADLTPVAEDEVWEDDELGEESTDEAPGEVAGDGVTDGAAGIDVDGVDSNGADTDIETDTDDEDDDEGAESVEALEADDDVDGSLFAFLPPGTRAPGWLPVFAGELPDGREVVFAHADSAELRSVAVFDAIIDNSDRKGSHVRRSPEGHLWGIDHGVTLHSEPKLRTVLWGWAGDPVPEADLARVAAVREALEPGALRDELATLLTAREVDALVARVDRLLTEGTHPLPAPGWPAVPWPVL